MPGQINQDFAKRLIPILGKEEAFAVLRILFEEVAGGHGHRRTPEQEARLEEAIVRLEKNEPLQYVLGKAHFMGLDLIVDSTVLIPRPETEELVDWILKSEPQAKSSVLDLCTGSGCIALALRAHGRWETVSGLDVSGEALNIARQNSEALKLPVIWTEADLLKVSHLDSHWEVIVANPPYVLPEEAAEMEAGVLHFEPHLALFTPSPILFYERIATLASTSLKPGGSLYFELNPKTLLDVKKCLETLGFLAIETKSDMQGKTRMLRASKPYPSTEIH